MDRFIGIAKSIVELHSKDLKSNMDRFIVPAMTKFHIQKIFKIQYG